MADETKPPDDGQKKGKKRAFAHKARASEGNQKKGVVIENAVLSARAFVREYLRKRITADEETDLQKLVDPFVDHLLAQEPQIVHSLIRDAFRWYILEEGRRIIGEARGVTDIFVSPSGSVLTEANLIQRTIRLAKKWYQRKESVAPHRYVFLVNMTSEDLLAVANIREAQTEKDRIYIIMYREMAPTLEPGQTVGERYTPEEIEAKYQEIENRRDSGAASN